MKRQVPRSPRHIRTCRGLFRWGVGFNKRVPWCRTAKRIQRFLEQQHMLVANRVCILRTQSSREGLSNPSPGHPAGRVSFEHPMWLARVVTKPVLGGASGHEGAQSWAMPGQERSRFPPRGPVGTKNCVIFFAPHAVKRRCQEHARCPRIFQTDPDPTTDTGPHNATCNFEKHVAIVNPCLVSRGEAWFPERVFR